MSNAAGAVSQMSTEAVLRNHLRSARLGVDAVMDDYTDQSVLMTHHATYRGRAEIRLFFTASQNPGCSAGSMANRKWSSVGEVGSHVGVAPLISVSGLNAVVTIQ